MTIKFHDVSHYQGDYHPNGPTIAKATEGTSFVDSRYAQNKARTLAGGWEFSAYHFLDPGNVAAQAQHAFKVVGKTPLMLDVERSSGGNASWADTKAFCLAYRALGGVLHLAYIPKWYWSGTWHSPSLLWLTANNIGLISSNYTTYSDSGVGWSAYGGVKPSIWQFTSTPLDTNAFKGTQAQLGVLFRTGPAVGVPKPPNPVYAIGPFPGTLKLGSKGNNVVKIQKKLNLNGYPLVADGDFGAKTESAVKKLQKDKKLTQDGIVGPKTWAAISKLPK